VQLGSSGGVKRKAKSLLSNRMVGIKRASKGGQGGGVYYGGQQVQGSRVAVGTHMAKGRQNRFR
jgi:hypothetical protein